jgi:hypothetical protein
MFFLVFACVVVSVNVHFNRVYYNPPLLGIGVQVQTTNMSLLQGWSMNLTFDSLHLNQVSLRGQGGRVLLADDSNSVQVISIRGASGFGVLYTQTGFSFLLETIVSPSLSSLKPVELDAQWTLKSSDAGTSETIVPINVNYTLTVHSSRLVSGYISTCTKSNINSVLLRFVPVGFQFTNLQLPVALKLGSTQNKDVKCSFLPVSGMQAVNPQLALFEYAFTMNQQWIPVQTIHSTISY